VLIIATALAIPPAAASLDKIRLILSRLPARVLANLIGLPDCVLYLLFIVNSPLFF